MAYKHASMVPNSHHATPVYWPKEATLLLIELYKRNESRFSSGVVRKKLIWKEIESAVQQLGHPFTWEQCEGRWKTLIAAYRRAAQHNWTCQYHKELSEVVSCQATSPHPRSQKQAQAVGTLPNPLNPLLFPLTPQASTAGLTNGHMAMPGPAPRRGRKRQWANVSGNNGDVIAWLAHFEERQERRSQELAARMEKMHSEKLAMMSELIHVIKDLPGGDSCRRDNRHNLHAGMNGEPGMHYIPQ